MMQEQTTRYEEAAAALHAAGQRVTHERMDDWLRARDGRGCSPRDAQPLVERYRSVSTPKIESAYRIAAEALAPLVPFERQTVLARLRKTHGRAT